MLISAGENVEIENARGEVVEADGMALGTGNDGCSLTAFPERLDGSERGAAVPEETALGH